MAFQLIPLLSVHAIMVIMPTVSARSHLTINMSQPVSRELGVLREMSSGLLSFNEETLV